MGPGLSTRAVGPDGPKSVQPIASRLGLRGHDQLHHFISSAAWNDGPLWRVLAQQADAVVGGDEAVLVVDDTALPKKGIRSVGVAPQYCGELGKQANCQSLVSLTLARDEVPVPIGLRLFLPKSWTDDPARCAVAGVPETVPAAQTKPRDRSRAGRWHSLWLRPGRCRLRSQRAVPPRSERAGPGLVGRDPPHADRLHHGHRAVVSACWQGKATSARRVQRTGASGSRHVGGLPLAAHCLAAGQQRSARGPVAAVRVRVADGPRSPRHGHLPGEEV
jgi:hypothetical protein